MKEMIRTLALSMGADVCGFAGIDRFADAPEGFLPTDVYPACQTVIVIGIALPRGLWKISPRLVYQHFNELADDRIDQMELELARAIERRFGGAAVPVPCDSPYEYWDAQLQEGRGLLSMKHAAVCAGLGTLGKNTMLLTRAFGNRLNLGAVLTDLSLPSDPPAKAICIEGCSKCVDNCPVGAIQNGRVVQALCRAHAYGQKTARGYDTTECNRCRTVCPLAMGMSSEAL